MNERLYLGVEIGGTKIQVAAGDGQARMLEVRKFDVDKRLGARGIKAQIREGVEYFKARQPVAAIGIGFGGPVNWQTGVVARSHQVEGWSGFNLQRWAAQLAGGAPAQVDNDANVAALAEAKLGAGAGRNLVCYVTLGSGVGGGFVLGGEIYHGAFPGESEIGHLRLDPSGVILEERCSGWSVDRRIRAEIKKKPSSKLARLVRRDRRGEAKHLGAALEAGDPLARSILQETARDLAFGLSHVAHLFHPEVIVLGGGLSKVGAPLRSAVAAHLKSFLMEVFQPGPLVRIAKLGDQVVPAGALLLAKKAGEAALTAR